MREKTIGIIAAMQLEADALLALLSDPKETRISGLSFTQGSLDGKKVVIAVCGEGKVNAALCAQTMILKYAPTLIINTGVAGALSPTLHVPDVAVALDVAEHDYDLSPLGYPKGTVLCLGNPTERFIADTPVAHHLLEAAAEAGVHAEAGTIVSGDQFIADEAKKRALHQDFGGIACEMEGGAIGHVCVQNGVRFAAVRAISDTADDGTKYDPVRAAAISVNLTRRLLGKL